MSAQNVLVKLFEHNDWANARLIEACSALSDEQLDAPPALGGEWSVRRILVHLVAAQQGYLSLLTLPVEARQRISPAFSEFHESARTSGAGLLALAAAESGGDPGVPLRTTDGYSVEAWVVMVQAINHATEHRRQISGLLRALGVTPPDLDAWTYAEEVGVLIPISK